MAQQVKVNQLQARDNFRLFVILLLTAVYPLFVTSFYALYIFILLPVLVHGKYSLQDAHKDGWYHYYWLFVAFLWILLCALILPCFRDKTVKTLQTIGMDIRESPPYPTKPNAVQPYVQIEEVNEKQRCSILTDKSQNSSDSIAKLSCNDKAEKESLEKFRESLQGSCTSLNERKKITQSGEFLNDFIGSVGSDELKEKEIECEVHAEENKDSHKQNNEDVDHQGIMDKDNEDKSDVSEDSNTEDEDNIPSDKEEKENMPQDKNKQIQETMDKKKDEKPTEDLTEAASVEPINAVQKVKQQETTPLQVADANIMESKPSELEEGILELNEEVAPLRQKARPTIDTSRASGYYECSMPTPKSADSTRPESNMVFLYVNPDIASTEESIQVEHEGEVQNAEN